MELTVERAQEVASHLKLLVVEVNSITKDDIGAVLKDISISETLGPILDPTGWRDENWFDKANGTKKVMQALLRFKEEVKGVGDFSDGR